MMHIRKLSNSDLASASALCMDAFMLAVAPSLSALGVETFTKTASVQALAERMEGENLLLVCVEDGAVTGLIEVKERRHVTMLFVAPHSQRRGIGRRLMSAATAQIQGQVVTVRASLSSVAAYHRYGFVTVGDVAEFSGLVYQAMEKQLPCE